MDRWIQELLARISRPMRKDQLLRTDQKVMWTESSLRIWIQLATLRNRSSSPSRVDQETLSIDGHRVPGMPASKRVASDFDTEPARDSSHLDDSQVRRCRQLVKQVRETCANTRLGPEDRLGRVVAQVVR